MSNTSFRMWVKGVLKTLKIIQESPLFRPWEWDCVASVTGQGLLTPCSVLHPQSSEQLAVLLWVTSQCLLMQEWKLIKACHQAGLQVAFFSPSQSWGVRQQIYSCYFYKRQIAPMLELRAVTGSYRRFHIFIWLNVRATQGMACYPLVLWVKLFI